MLILKQEGRDKHVFHRKHEDVILAFMYIQSSRKGVCFQAWSRRFHIARKCKSINVKMQSECLSPLPIFSFESGLNALCYPNVISSFVTFSFRKMWKLIVLLSPSHFRAWLSQILSRARDMGRVCGYKCKIKIDNPSLKSICKSIICHSTLKCNFLALFAMPNNV